MVCCAVVEVVDFGSWVRCAVVGHDGNGGLALSLSPSHGGNGRFFMGFFSSSSSGGDGLGGFFFFLGGL